MSGQHIIIEQLRADVERLRDDLSATEARLEVSYDAYERDCRDLRGKMTRAQTDRDHARLDRDSAIARAEKAERERDEWKAKHDTLADVSRACIATTERERDEARANYAFMVKRAADQKLDGYRELGARAAAAEERADRAERERDEARAERALREHKRRADLDSRLGDALRASGINAADALAVQALYATAGQSGSHRIVSALRAVEAWLREGGAL